MKKKILIPIIILGLLLLGAMSTTLMAQRHTDKLDRGLVVSKVANANYLSWRRLSDEYFDVTYNVYRGNSKVATELTTTNFQDNNSSEANTYTIRAVINGIEHMTQTIVYILICINVVTFLVYGIDKWKAKQGSWRISEATLLILAVFGGSIGALLGMKVWHHKTMHKKFKYGLPLILLAQIALIYFICNFSHRSYV